MLSTCHAPGTLFSILQAGELWDLLHEVVSRGSSRALLRALPPLEEPGQIFGVGGPLPGHSRLPTVSWVSPPFSGGLVCTSSVSWPSMVLRGSIVAPQVLPADRTQSS